MSALQSNFRRACVLGVALAMSSPVLSHADSPHAHNTAAPAVSKAAVTQDALRDLWIGHVFWVRNVVTETLSGNAAAANAAEKEVVANAKAIAGAIEPFYGKAASEKLFGLLAGHYGAIKDYLTATKANQAAAQQAALGKLTSNANEIAVFLSGANPNLPVDTLRGLLTAHGGHHVQQIQQLHAKQYAEEARTWEAMKNHMYVIADALTNAIAKQFPEKFS